MYLEKANVSHVTPCHKVCSVIKSITSKEEAAICMHILKTEKKTGIWWWFYLKPNSCSIATFLGSKLKEENICVREIAHGNKLNVYI